MNLQRNELPQLFDQVFLTDGGLETTLIFHDGFDLPCFASFPLLKDEQGREALQNYYQANKYLIAESDDLLDRFEKSSGVSLDRLYEQWLYTHQ